MKINVNNYISKWLLCEERRINNNVIINMELAGINLSINPNVFLPDPKITHSTSLLLKSIEKSSLNGKEVLDLGTGSGFFAIYSSLKGAASVVATDIDKNILKQASNNALTNKVTNIEFIESNVFDNVEGLYDYIFVNGPISNQAWSESKSGGHSIASYGEALFSQYRNHLKPGGQMLMTFSEIGPVNSFYETLKVYKVKYDELREDKFGIWWGVYRISR